MKPRRSLSRESGASNKSASYHGHLPGISGGSPKIKRPESNPDLTSIPSKSFTGNSILPENSGQKLTKLLLNVTIQRSLGPVHVVMSPENTVEDLIKAALEIYSKEKIRPLLTETDSQRFELHYSQFSLESLNPKEKLINLGSRNFFLCPKPT